MRRWGAVVLAAAAVFVLAACGDDDGGDEASGSEPASGSASAPSACEPVGDGGGTQIDVVLDEFAVRPASATAPAGAVTFRARNDGEEPHEIVVVRADGVEDFTVVDGRVDEEALPKGAFIGEIEAFPSGESCSRTFTLDAGPTCCSATSSRSTTALPRATSRRACTPSSR